MANYLDLIEIEMYFNWFLAWGHFEGFLAEFFFLVISVRRCNGLFSEEFV
jgi:hypothetical protein